ncbi:3-oxoacyl-(acyl-carrier-protein) synthase III [Solidesulfovibrio carbinoliphilus subsp. oakridgensis]|uniref:3-oxoacyl-(Acyl-carrier-protein) synthase III n=2 Tax=Solidesulfovibrio carbinoliphilus TaxID=345370 RepID=G7Q7L1_9BACT|nr:beta-ketoacyl-ACP synthase 3 [Solidesulfovibrio carbinoliphilus]EHJ47164.1 3-oxoacyl-(acyl-carrier-protein) synthase III [Solidesulfovibrio carbinoliphilus subsp. oakridgensis]
MNDDGEGTRRQALGRLGGAWGQGAGLCVLAGMGGYLPRDGRDNAELAKTYGVTEDWIYSRTGIRRRRILPAGQNTSDMAVEAARAALADSGTDPADLTHVLVASCAPDGLVPNTACTVERKLGLSGLVALDFNVACSGFLYGLYLTSAIVRLEPGAVVLLVAAEAMSRLCAPGDRSVNVIFGDGAGAAVVTARRGALVVEDIVVSSDGKNAGILTANGGGSRAAYASPDSRVGEDYFLRMEGREVFRLAVSRMAGVSLALLARNGLSPADVDLFVPHQANGRIIEAVGDRLGIPAARTAAYIEDVGNTSAASIPLALEQARAQGRLRPGGRVLLASFGAGFTWGAALVRVDAAAS